MTTAEGRTLAFQVEPLTTGDREQRNASAEGRAETERFKTNGEERFTTAERTLTTHLEGPDPVVSALTQGCRMGRHHIRRTLTGTLQVQKPLSQIEARELAQVQLQVSSLQSLAGHNDDVR